MQNVITTAVNGQATGILIPSGYIYQQEIKREQQKRDAFTYFLNQLQYAYRHKSQ